MAPGRLAATADATAADATAADATAADATAAADRYITYIIVWFGCTRS
jgi:hypothetical protein